MNRISDEEREEFRAIGARLRRLREYLGYTQDDIAKALDVRRPIVSMIEAGTRRPNAVDLKRLSTLFAVPVSHLLGEPEDGHQASAALREAIVGLGDDDRAELLRFAEYLHYRRARRAGPAA